jgi:subtilisin family serine protease
VRRSPALLCLLAVVAACAVPAGAQASGRSRAELQRLEDEGVRDIVVARDPGLTATARGDLRAGAGVAHVAELPLPDTEVVRAPAGGLIEAVDTLEAEPGVRYAEPNGPVHAAAADPLLPQLWNLPAIGAPTAWTQSTGAGQRVAVVDSGVAAHEDLAGALWTNPGEAGALATNGVDDDDDGFVDDARGWDFIDSDNDPTDTNGHGTHVTGTLVARRDNGLGIAGVAPDAQVLALRALDGAGAGTDATVAAAFDYAGALGVPIVNASVEAAKSQTIADAMDRHPGTLFVLAAGNAGANDDDPATASLCQLPEANLICVAASDQNDARATFTTGSSNVGATTVDLFAPGDNIPSTYIDSFCAPEVAGCYALLDGTSMAAPHVSATLALMRARNPALTGAQLKARLLASVDAKATLAGLALTGGRLNAAAAVAAAAPPTPAAATGTTTTVVRAPAVVPRTAVVPASGAAVPATPVAVVPVLGRPSIARGVLTARHPLTLRFTLDRAATVKLTVTRGTRTIATVSLHGRKGQNRYVLHTRVGGKRLAPGRYRVHVRARGATRAYTFAVTVR